MGAALCVIDLTQWSFDNWRLQEPKISGQLITNHDSEKSHPAKCMSTMWLYHSFLIHIKRFRLVLATETSSLKRNCHFKLTPKTNFTSFTKCLS